MPLVTGTLTDIGMDALVGRSPLLRFTPSASAVASDGTVFASAPVDVEPDANGAFSVELATTRGLVPRNTHWRLEVLWRGDSTDGHGYTASDFPAIQIHVGSVDASIIDVLGGPDQPFSGRISVSVEEPDASLGFAAWIDISGEVPRFVPLNNSIILEGE